MAGELNEKQLADMKEAFSNFDTNGDGNICIDELKTAMFLMGNNPTDDDMKSIMNDIDIDKNGVINFDEFCHLISKYLKDPEDEEQSLKEAFQVFDRNGDGSVSAAEIKYLLKGMGQEITDEEISIMMSQTKLDEKGGLDYRAFVKVMSAKVL